MITINPKQISKYIHWVNDITMKHALDKIKECDDAMSTHAPKYRKSVPAPPPIGGYQPTVSAVSQPPNVGSSVRPNPNYVPPSSVAKPKERENNNMYGLKLYITLDDINAYIHNNLDEVYKNHTFVPVKTEFNDLDNSIEISLISANPIDPDAHRYKLDLNKLTTQKTEPCRDCSCYQWDMPQCKECNAENNFKYFRKW